MEQCRDAASNTGAAKEFSSPKEEACRGSTNGKRTNTEDTLLRVCGVSGIVSTVSLKPDVPPQLKASSAQDQQGAAAPFLIARHLVQQCIGANLKFSA